MMLFVKKTKIYINFPAFCIATLIIILSKSNALFWGMLAAVLHEFGHVFIMIKNNNIPSAININLFDIKITERSVCQCYKQDIITLLFGPLFNLITYFFILTLNMAINKKILICFMNENLILGLFNLLPINLLDGGKILYILICKCKNCILADKILKIISLSILMILTILGFFIFLSCKYNFSLLFISLYLIIIEFSKRDCF